MNNRVNQTKSFKSFVTELSGTFIGISSTLEINPLDIKMTSRNIIALGIPGEGKAYRIKGSPMNEIIVFK